MPVNKMLMVERENNRIHSGEYVLLVSLSQQSIEQKADPEFNELLDKERGDMLNQNDELAYQKKVNLESIKNSLFFKKHIDEGKYIEDILIAEVNDIEKDFTCKLFVLPTIQQNDAISKSGKIWKIVRLPQNHN